MKSLFTASLVAAIACTSGLAATVDPFFASEYSAINLGSIPGVPANYGGITFKWDDPNTLLIGGAANSGSGAIYSIGVVRDSLTQSITGFSGSATLFSTAANIDGGLAYGPGNVLFYTGYSNNILGQIKPGSSVPDKIINLSSLGVASSTGTLQFVPTGFTNSGAIMLASYNTSNFYTANLIADGNGTYDLGPLTSLGVFPGGPEGMVYVGTNNPLIDVPSMLISEYGSGRVSIYELDTAGNPLVGTRRDFVTGLSGAEGATIDPVTGEFYFSTFGGGNQVVKVTGFVPEPSAALLAPLGLLLAARRRRK